MCEFAEEDLTYKSKGAHIVKVLQRRVHEDKEESPVVVESLTAASEVVRHELEELEYSGCKDLI